MVRSRHRSSKPPLIPSPGLDAEACRVSRVVRVLASSETGMAFEGVEPDELDERELLTADEDSDAEVNQLRQPGARASMEEISSGRMLQVGGVRSPVDWTLVPHVDIVLEKSPGETYFPFGLWSNGTTLLASDWGSGELVGYALSGGARAADRDIDASAAGIGSPAGMVSDGSTLWVVDDTGKRLAAFAVP